MLLLNGQWKSLAMTSVKTAAFTVNLLYLTSTEPKQHSRQDKTLWEYLNTDQCYIPTCTCHVFCLVPNHSFSVERTPHTRQAEAEFKQVIKFNDSEALCKYAPNRPVKAVLHFASGLEKQHGCQKLPTPLYKPLLLTRFVWNFSFSLEEWPASTHPTSTSISFDCRIWILQSS